jgi:hypothetical protein
MVQSTATDDGERKVLDDIAKYGWHCLNILEENGQPPWAARSARLSAIVSRHVTGFARIAPPCPRGLLASLHVVLRSSE